MFGKDGQEGLEVARQVAPDLIISDVMMPHVDGQNSCRRIKEDSATAHIPFVMLTAKAELSMKIGGLNCAADDYLIKPLKRTSSRRAFARCCDSAACIKTSTGATASCARHTTSCAICRASSFSPRR